MVHRLIKSRRSTLITHYGQLYSGIEDYELKERARVVIRGALNHPLER